MGEWVGIAYPYVEIQTDLPLLFTKFHREVFNWVWNVIRVYLEFPLPSSAIG